MKKQKNQPFRRFLFVVYCALMIWLLFCRPQGWVEGKSYRQMLQMNINLQPLLTIRNYLYVIKHRTNEALMTHCLINLAGNVLLFIPAGWLLPGVWKRMRNFFLFFMTCAAAIFLVEVLQLLTLLGSFDVDDLILNLSGMTVGYLAYMIANGKRR